MSIMNDFVTEFLHGDAIAQTERDFHERLRRMKREEKLYSSARRVAKTLRPEVGQQLLNDLDVRFGEKGGKR
jgi:hypothetical protein